MTLGKGEDTVLKNLRAVSVSLTTDFGRTATLRHCYVYTCPLDATARELMQVISQSHIPFPKTALHSHYTLEADPKTV